MIIDHPHLVLFNFLFLNSIFKSLLSNNKFLITNCFFCLLFRYTIFRKIPRMPFFLMIELISSCHNLTPFQAIPNFIISFSKETGYYHRRSSILQIRRNSDLKIKLKKWVNSSRNIVNFTQLSS